MNIDEKQWWLNDSPPTDKLSIQEKKDKRQKLARNEFLSTDRYGIPLIKNQFIDIDRIQPWGYSKTKVNDEENRHKTIHFFTYDWLYESVYVKPESALEKLSQYYALMTPDFSCYLDMPLALQIYSTFKNRWCGAFWQKHGMKVIPTIEWGDERSFEFCFEGVETGSVVAVATYYREQYKKEFMLGYNEMLQRLKPSVVLCYGDVFNEMTGNIKMLSPFDHEKLIKQMGLSEYAKRYLSGEIYPSN